MAALLAGSLVNEAVIIKSDSVLQQAKASDTWAYYQAKGIKAVSANETADLLAVSAVGKANQSGKWRAEAAREKTGQAELKKKAEDLESVRDEKDGEAAGLLKRHEVYAWCVTCMQVAISLSAIAALTKRKDVWKVSIVLGLAGTGLFIFGFMQHAPVHTEASTGESRPTSGETGKKSGGTEHRAGKRKPDAETEDSSGARSRMKKRQNEVQNE